MTRTKTARWIGPDTAREPGDKNNDDRARGRVGTLPHSQHFMPRDLD